MPSETMPNAPAAARNGAADNGPAKELTIQQIAALDALLNGSSVTDAAAAAGVDRSSVHNWLRKNFAFQAALNRGRKDMRQAIVHRLERLANNATECVDKAVREGNVKVALEVVKRVNVFSRFCGSDDPAELEIADDERCLDQREKASRSKQRADRLKVSDPTHRRN